MEGEWRGPFDKLRANGIANRRFGKGSVRDGGGAPFDKLRANGVANRRFGKASVRDGGRFTHRPPDTRASLLPDVGDCFYLYEELWAGEAGDYQ